MKNRYIVTILITLFVLCIQKCTSDDKWIQIYHLWQARHWDEMTWFDKIVVETPTKKKAYMDFEKNELWAKRDLSTVNRLTIIPILMECGYGKKLIDFLLISTYTVIECRDLSEYDQPHAQDCWLKLEESLKKGMLTMFILSRTYVQINKLDRRLKETNRFYITLWLLHGFLMRSYPCVKNSLTATEATNFLDGIKHFATHLENMWNDTCQPAYTIISEEELQNEYEHQPRVGDEVPIPNLYDFYVDKLHSSTDFITKHMHKVGFDYSPMTEKVTFIPPAGSSVTHQ